MKTTSPGLAIFATLCAIELSSSLLTQPTAFSNRWVVQISGGLAIANRLAGQYGFTNLGQVGNLKDYFYFELMRGDNEEPRIQSIEAFDGLTRNLKNSPQVGYAEQEVLKKVESYTQYSPPSDPGWPQQWSLSDLSGADINVEPAWLQGVDGSGIIVAIVDNGVEIYHQDLAQNYDKQRSWDFDYNDSNPVPDDYALREAHHGTSCAGEVSMVKDNGICGAGVAHGSHFAALKFNFSAVTNAEKARMWSYMADDIDIYSNSFGPENSGFVVDGPNRVLNLSLATAVQQGRNGKGSVFVLASGNGGFNNDSCAANGYASSIYTIAVGSADQNFHEAVFDEACAAKMVVTFSFNSTGGISSSEGHHQVYTTFLNGNCNDTFTGTSASAPLVSAVIALALQANANLTWRDVQYLLVYTSNPSILKDGEFQLNGGGLNVSHKHGFGALDAEAMVTRARRWINVPPQHSFSTGGRLFGIAHPGQPYSGTFNITAEHLPLEFIEHVIVIMAVNIEGYNKSYGIGNYSKLKAEGNWTQEEEHDWLISPHPRRGDIKIELTSPAGTTSILLPYRDLDFVNDEGYEDWPFTSVQHWGENPLGEWQLVVTYRSSSAHVTISAADLTLYGTTVVPPAIHNIPAQCDVACKRACSGVGSQHCDACAEKRVTSTLECVSQCPKGTYLYKSRYCNSYSNPTPALPTTPPRTKLPFSTLMVVIVGSTLTGLTFAIAITILVCMIVCKKKRDAHQQVYVRLQFEDLVPDGK